MSKQIIIAFGREYGSLGHEIASILAKKLEVKLYDRELMDELVKAHGFDPEIVEKFDEKPNPIFTKNIMGYSSSVEEIIANKVFECERSLAESGESFVIVGRCSDYVLRDYPGIIRIFVTGDYDVKLAHIMKEFNLDAKTAKDKIAKHDKHRKSYHNYHSDTKWGDSRAYDITINSSVLGVAKTADVLYEYVKSYMDR